MSSSREIESIARAAVAAADPILRNAWTRTKRIEHKGVIDLVTETDREVEALVTSHLRTAFPDHRIIAEEASAGTRVIPPADDEYVWYIDPLDGTVNFAHSFPVFSVSLGFARGKELLFGIVHDPTRQETFIATRGEGARCNDVPICVSNTLDIGQALLSTGFPYDVRSHTDFYLGYFRDFLLNAQAVRRGGSAAIDLCWVACGRLDGFWEWKLQPWDTAAGALIITEAGGQTSDFGGNPFNVHGPQTVASNKGIHSSMIEVLRNRSANTPCPF